jgi:hypothetical protein
MAIFDNADKVARLRGEGWLDAAAMNDVGVARAWIAHLAALWRRA